MQQVMLKIITSQGESLYRFSSNSEQEFYTIRHLSGPDIGGMIGQYESHFELDEVLNILQNQDGIEGVTQV